MSAFEGSSSTPHTHAGAEVSRIHEWARQGDVNGVRRELDSGVPVDVRDPRSDRTPLAEAAASPDGTCELLRLLLERGADPNAVCGKERKSVILLAVKTWDVDRISQLLDAGAAIAFQDKGGYDAILSCLYSSGDERRLLATVELLLRRGAPLGRTSKHGQAPLLVASRRRWFHVVAALLAVGEDPAPLRWTELHRAVALGSVDAVRRVVAGGAALDARDWIGRTPWFLSIEVGDLEKIEVLASAGSDRSVRDRTGTYALLRAVEGGNSRLVEWLIAAGADVDQKDEKHGTTALMKAAGAAEVEMVEHLLRAGANATAIDKYRHTVMSKATTVDVMRRLQAAGADAADIGERVRRELTRLAARPLLFAREDFHAGRVRSFGQQNPERIETLFCRAMVFARAYASAARCLCAPAVTLKEPVWCYGRYGQSITELGDGRVVEIGGEHEDWYDPDFCIYNDVVVYDGKGDFTIYGYPRHVFPPTDFHTATAFDGWIYVIGSLGYSADRTHGRAQVFKLSTTDFHMERVETRGDDPGWISHHRARLRPDGLVHVSGGKLETENDYLDSTRNYTFDLATHTWRANG